MRENMATIWLVSTMLASCGGGGGGTGGNGNVQAANLQCNGVFDNLPASVSGVRQFEAYNAIGDGYLRFSGTLTTSSETAPMVYEDYSNLAPYEGRIESSSVGSIPVSVLDATGTNNNTMLIYYDVPSLGPPTILGQFTCVWF